MHRSFHKICSLNGCIALVLACNYLAFQAELFDDEYERNHLPAPTRLSVSSLSTTWESFDKENAPEAFVVEPVLHLECLLVLRPARAFDSFVDPPFQPTRDKSPPES